MQDRRKRISRPLPILVFGSVFLLLPVVSYVNFADEFGVMPKDFMVILSRINTIALFLSIFPIFIGIGILSVKKWGWWSFLAYSISVLIYNLIVLVSEPTRLVGNLLNLTQSLVGFSAIFYFLKPDIAAPYMNVDKRGWRFQKRKPIEIPVLIASIQTKTIDLSATGLYAEWKSQNLELNQEVDVEFDFALTKFKAKAGVVRIDAIGIGLAFRNLEKHSIEELSKWVSSKEVES